MKDLETLRAKSIELYFKYKDGLISLENYILQIKYLDIQIDKIEIQVLNCHLVGNPALQTPSLKYLH
jgi:hypothetical protein